MKYTIEYVHTHQELKNVEIDADSEEEARNRFNHNGVYLDRMFGKKEVNLGDSIGDNFKVIKS